jgi:hypothetical protein
MYHDDNGVEYEDDDEYDDDGNDDGNDDDCDNDDDVPMSEDDLYRA